MVSKISMNVQTMKKLMSLTKEEAHIVLKGLEMICKEPSAKVFTIPTKNGVITYCRPYQIHTYKI